MCGLVSERNGDDPHTRTNEVSEIAHGSDQRKRRWGVSGEAVRKRMARTHDIESDETEGME